MKIKKEILVEGFRVLLNFINTNFFKRALTAILGGILLLFVINLGSLSFFLLVLIISILLFYEYCNLLYKIKIVCYKALCTMFLIFIEFFFFLQNNISNFNKFNIFHITLTLFLILILSIPILFSFFKKDVDIRSIFMNIVGSIFGIFYIGWMFSHLILIREFFKKELTYSLFIIIWIMDTVAYIFGSYVGKTKFTKISPNKSVEGSIFALIFSIFSSVILHNFIFKIDFLSIKSSIIIGIFIGIFAQVGDIFESLIKRLSGEKDSGFLLPGHGGFLDRFDSIIFSAPLYFYFLLIMETLSKQIIE